MYICALRYTRYQRNPPALRHNILASIAQLAEHLPRKQKVSSSNLDGGYWAVGLEV